MKYQAKSKMSDLEIKDLEIKVLEMTMYIQYDSAEIGHDGVKG